MITFSIFKKTHLPTFRAWLNQDHIKAHWQETGDDSELENKFFVDLPARGIRCFIIENGNREVGFIQYYEAAKVGGGWWPHEKPGVFGVDLLIGDKSETGRGLGPEIIRHFIEFIKTREPSVKSFIIDPDPTNHRAIRAFEKAGFVREREITTPGGPALLMRRGPP